MKPNTNQPDEYVIVLTACIDPGDKHPRLQRRDPEVRLRDYQEALSFWVTHPDPRLRKIVFIENTGYSLEALEESARAANSFGKELEFLSFQCNECPPGLTYGYPELTMLDRGFSESQLIQSSRYLVKATGRLRFPELPRLLDRLPKEYLFAVDGRNNRFQSLPFVPTQLMIFSVDFYRTHLLGLREQMTPNLALIEYLFYEKLMTFQGQPGAILRWPVNVEPLGKAGHNAKEYSAPKQRLFSMGRAACRVLLPQWWI